ncbi:DUF389 domain-containing protein [Actinocorallia herbida]|nr:DUF389 domain-containing protein [Actinocorallia herbida]
MLHVRAIVPPDETDAVVAELALHVGVTNVVVLPGAARVPSGDVVLCDVAREATDDVLTALKARGIARTGSIAASEVDLALSDAAAEAEERAPGHGDDAVVWDQVFRHLQDGSRLTWTFGAFLVLATMLAGIAALLDSPILVVGAMVLGPEFVPIAAIAFALLTARWELLRRANLTLVVGFVLAIAVTYVCTRIGRFTGFLDLAELPADRPLTGFVYSPDRWSFLVAILAGIAGVLSLTSGKAEALVGVFISVTTVPAAGNLAVALALGHYSEVRGSVLQLGVNIGGMIIAGIVTFVVQWLCWKLVLRRGMGRSEEG